ncbi:MAG: hypothetical protein HZC38_15115 [Chloroflexi bacterium]|nr:hypothetical protein [Chloroflexota bacterium]MBI5714727.1 hypothetical protein [Chloroflexota bacterium]
MTVQVLPPQDLVRKTILEVVSLPEKDMLTVLEFVGKIKQREKEGLPKLTVAEIHAEANRIAAETANLSRKEIMNRFRETVEQIRTEAIAKGTALDGEWERD